MTHEQQGMWKTPGPWLGLILGFGIPALMGINTLFGWAIALPVLVMALAVMAVWLRRFESNTLVRAYGSAALMRYNIRMLIASGAYTAGMLFAVSVYNHGMPSGAAAYVIALLPTVPALGMILVMGRYLVEETDEYLRHRASLCAMIGLGCVLVLGTVWGFLETFGLVPHIWAWWVVPVWAIGLAIGQGILGRRERADEDEHEGANGRSA